MDFPTLIIGGGVSGITAAVELAETGVSVILVEKEPYLGGKVSKFNNYFPKLCPPSCGLEINFRRIRSNPRITFYTGAKVIHVSGIEGAFRVKIALSPRMINNLCTACGLCAEVCPEKRTAEAGSEAGQKAAYINGSLSFPMKYTIDHQICRGESCGLCAEVCEFEAVQLSAVESEIELQAEKLIIATGWESYDAGRIENYCYEEDPDVLSNLEFEQVLAACGREGKKLTRPSDACIPKSIAFVQCAGSRDEKHLPYCSAVCCTASVKHALTLAESYPEIRTEIFYIDLRLPGRNEKLLNKAEDLPTIKLTKGKVGRIERKEEELVLEVEDILAGKKRSESFSMVVLATGMVPSIVLPGLAVNEAGFLRPIQKKGIFPASSCKRPMDVSTSVKDATSTALKTLRKDHE